jgi:hypothetical protein
MTDRDEYLAAFMRSARPAAAGDLADWAGTLESLDLEYETLAEASHVYAVATAWFRGRRYRYRRRIWPADHPAPLKAALYATTLTERLLTTPPPTATGDNSSVIML